MRNVIVIFCLLGLVACTKPTRELKSPCVGTESSPCGPKRPVNAYIPVMRA